MTTENRYTIESLIQINPSFHREHGINEHDLQLANDWVRYIESTRSEVTPLLGDRVHYTCKHGDFTSHAVIEKKTKDKFSICIQPYTPFIFEYQYDYYLDVSGGPFASIPTDLKYIGKTKALFKDWGHYGACANGSVHFEAEVSTWEYSEPDPYYGEYTTKEWRKFYFHQNNQEHRWGTGYLYRGESKSERISFHTEAEFQEFIIKYKGKVFQGNYPEQLVVWCHHQEYQNHQSSQQ